MWPGVRPAVFGEISSGKKYGGKTPVVRAPVARCPAVKWVDTQLTNQPVVLVKSDAAAINFQLSPVLPASSWLFLADLCRLDTDKTHQTAVKADCELVPTCRSAAILPAKLMAVKRNLYIVAGYGLTGLSIPLQ